MQEILTTNTNQRAFRILSQTQELTSRISLHFYQLSSHEKTLNDLTKLLELIPETSNVRDLTFEFSDDNTDYTSSIIPLVAEIIQKCKTIQRFYIYTPKDRAYTSEFCREKVPGFPVQPLLKTLDERYYTVPIYDVLCNVDAELSKYLSKNVMSVIFSYIVSTNCANKKDFDETEKKRFRSGTYI